MIFDQSTDSAGLNAMRSLLTGHVAVQPGEEMRSFERFAADLISDLHPDNAIERQLAHLYASLAWRIHRAAAIENTLLSLGSMEGAAARLCAPDASSQSAIRQAMAFRAHAEFFETLARYSQCLVSQGADVLRQLQHLQAQRNKKGGSRSKTIVAVG